MDRATILYLTDDEPMKIVLLGADGQVGWELQRALAPLGVLTALNRRGAVTLPGQDSPKGVFSREDSSRGISARENSARKDTSREGPSRADMPGEGSAGAGSAEGGAFGLDLCGDLEQPDALVATLRLLQPAVIVNAAAYTAVDRAESEPTRAYAVNAAAPGKIARVAAEIGALFIHYSTDYVFSGNSTRPWREDDATDPVNVYGESKLAGERQIQESGCQYLILRCSWVYAARGSNFLRTMLRLAPEREELRVVSDQFGAPTGAELIADVTAHVMRATVANRKLAGTYHLAASGTTDWSEYATFLIDFARSQGWPAQRVQGQSVARITAIPGSEYPTPARRPHYSLLDCSRLEQQFGLTLPDWRLGVVRTVTELL